MNTFGSAANQYPLYDPYCVREERARFRRDAVPDLQRANSLYVPTGQLPTRGWLLMVRADYARLDTYSTALQLSVGDPRKADNVGVLRGLAIVQAQCVTRGLASDENALYLVEVTDARGVLHNRWFQAPTTSMYNIRAPAYPQTFHPASMDGSTTWTWTTMLRDLWLQMPLLGAWPGLPAGRVPAGTPEGFWFPGVPAWHALCDVLAHVGLTVACDPTQDAPYTIVYAGDADAAHDARLAKYASTASRLYCLEDDQEWIDTGAGRVPRTVKVLFRRRNDVYGSEETVRYDLPQWDMAAYYAVDVDAPAAFAAAAGSHRLWSDFTVRYDQEGNPLGADVAVAQQIAAERVRQYFAEVYSVTEGFASQTYAGALPFATGPQVDGVCWYQNRAEQVRQGWKTKTVRGKYPPFDGVWEGMYPFPQGGCG